MRTIKLLNIMSFFSLASFALFLFVIGWWFFYPYKIIDFEQETFPIKNENKTVKQGDLLVYEVEYCKYVSLEATVTRTFNDGIIYSTTPTIGNREVGCKDNNVYLEVPKILPPAKYTLQITFQYKVNPLRTILISKNTEEFTVVK